MRKLLLSILVLLSGHLSGQASASCYSVWFENAQSGNVIMGNNVKIWFSGWSYDALYIDGNFAGSLPNGEYWETWTLPFDYTLSYGTHVVTVTSEACSESFTLVAPPTAPPGQQIAYRFYRRNGPGTVSDHFSTLDFNEGAWVGGLPGTYEGVYFKTHTSQIDGNMVPLYRCYGYWGDHFALTDPNCDGHTNEGLYGYISNIPRTGYTPLYLFARLNPWDFIETTSWDEVANWNQAGYFILGYVPE